MKNYKYPVFFFSILLLVQVLFFAGHFAYAAGKKGSVETIGSFGYCCIDGNLKNTSAVSCRSQKGIFFSDKNAADQNCRKKKEPQPSVKTPTATIEKEQNIIKKSSTSTDPGQVPERGYCCDDGRIENSFKGTCEKKECYFSVSRVEAQKYCDTQNGYCCLDGLVKKDERRDCTINNGHFFIRQREADRYCRTVSGYCCSDGTITPATKRQCDIRKGFFSSDRRRVVKKCDFEKGYCCLGDHVLSTISHICKNRDGLFFTSEKNAEIACRKEVIKRTKKRSAEKSALPGIRKESVKPSDKPEIFAGNQAILHPGLKDRNKNSTVPEEIVPLRYDREGDGIKITSPAGSEHFFQGETTYIVAELPDAVRPTGTINFTVTNQAGIVAGNASVPAAPVVSTEITLRNDAPIGSNYFVLASLAPDRGGESELFSIHRNSGRIDIVSPVREDELYPGGAIQITYKVSPRVESGPIVFDLYMSGEIIATGTEDYTPGPAVRAGRDSIHNYVLALPEDCPTGEVVLLGRHRVATGFSEPFSLARPRRRDIPPEPEDSLYCDWAIDHVSLATGGDLSEGIEPGSSDTVNGVFYVDISWNGVERVDAYPPGTSFIYEVSVYSALTGENLTASPTRFTYLEPISRHLAIRLPYSFDKDRIPSLTRDRFMPLEFRLEPASALSSLDAIEANNHLTADLRLLNVHEKNIELAVSGAISTRRVSGSGAGALYSLELPVRIRNLSRSETGSPPDPCTVYVNLCLDSYPDAGAPGSYPCRAGRSSIRINNVGAEWTDNSLELRFTPESGTSFRLKAEADEARILIDPDRSNNTILQIFRTSD